VFEDINIHECFEDIDIHECFVNRCLSFFFFIVLSVLLRFMASDYLIITSNLSNDKQLSLQLYKLSS
jgi:hypothetical protein